MIKVLIFDLDNTIIDSSSELAIYYKEALKNLGYDSNKYLELYNTIDDYEKTFNEKKNLYKKEDLLLLINDKMHENYDLKLIDEINNVIGKYWIKKILLDKETIEYLFSKYDLYVFSNWFYEAQYNRLKNIDYLKYFKKILTADKYGSKPYKSAFKNVFKEINMTKDECIMIGDSLNTDILGASSFGMKSIWFNYEGKKVDFNLEDINCKEVSTLKELRDIL